MYGHPHILGSFKLPKLTILRSDDCDLALWIQFCENNPNVEDLTLEYNLNVNVVVPFVAQHLKKLTKLRVHSTVSEVLVRKNTLRSILLHCEHLKELSIGELKGSADDYADIRAEFPIKLESLWNAMLSYEK